MIELSGPGMGSPMRMLPKCQPALQSREGLTGHGVLASVRARARAHTHTHTHPTHTHTQSCWQEASAPHHVTSLWGCLSVLTTCQLASHRGNDWRE